MSKKRIRTHQGTPASFDVNVDYDEQTGTITDHCTSRGFPLGGIGTGGFSIFTDGGFGKFRTNHNWFKSIKQAEYPRGSFFGIWISNGQEKNAKILRRSYQGGEEFTNASPIAHTHFTGKIPNFNLRYEDEELPVRLQLNGFTSLIPHNIKDSSLPGAFFQLEVENPTEHDLKISLLQSFENILGIGGSGGHFLLLPFDGPVSYKSTKGNFGEEYKQNEIRGVKFGTTQEYGPKDPRRRVVGEYYIYSDFVDAQENNREIEWTMCPSWDSTDKKPKLWERFNKTGKVDRIDSQGNAGAYAVKFSLGPGEKKKVNFYLMWWTPYYVIEKKQRIKKIFGNHKGVDYGHYYLQHFSNPEELLKYLPQERSRLKSQSNEVPKLVEKASIPKWLKTYTLNSTDSMLINTVLTKEGNYYMIEGVPWGWVFGALAGTVDQRLASHVYSAWFFPQLDRNELNTFFDLTKNGRVPHGSGHADVALSTEDIPYGMAIKIFNRTEHWVDLPQSLILQMGKHIIRSRDRDLLKKSWTKFTEMMDYLESAMVNDVPEGITTYDYMNYHPCFVYTAILHLATLRMMIRLGNLLKEQKDQAQEIESLIQKYEKQYEATKNSYIERLWKGEGYFKTCESHDTIFTSTLAGDWISRFVGFGPVVDFEKAKSHSQWQSKTLIDSHTSSKIKRKKTRPLVYREADLEGNERPLKVAFYNKYRVNNPWQSTVYQGIEAIYLDRVEKGLDLIKMIWEKGYYEGYPWNMDHWGMEGHIYMTHPGLWSVLHALSGVAYDSFEQTLSISPRKVGKEKSLELPAFFPDFWLWIEYSFQDQKLKIKVLKVHKKGLKIGNVKESKPNGESQVHNLPDPMEIKENEKITLKLEFNF